MKKKLEDRLVASLAEKLKDRYAAVYTNRKPSASRKVRNYLQGKLGYIPILQPEIDILLRDGSDRLYAIEIKVFTGIITYSLPYYEGLGQAIALHKYGFDYAALYTIFLSDTDIISMNRYGAEMWTFIRNDLCLPLDFTYFYVQDIDNNYVFNVMQYTNRREGIQLIPIDDPRFLITFKHPNPIKEYPLPSTVRDAIDKWLKDQL
jgi:hypothetical protein